MQTGNIQIVVEIPEEAYNLLKNEGVDWLGAEHILNAVANGKPIPSGHGRLKDIDKIERLLDLEKPDNTIAKALKNIIEGVPTIIESDQNKDEREVEEEREV